MKGYVYILSNPSIPHLLKIGYTTNTLKQRIQELSSSTGVAEPFMLECYCESIDPVDDERIIHQKLYTYRYSPNREFFKISVSQASETLESVCKTKACFSLPSKNITTSKENRKADFIKVKKAASRLFNSQKDVYVKNILADLPVVSYRKNAENNIDYIIYNWSPSEDNSPVGKFGKGIISLLNTIDNVVYPNHKGFNLNESIRSRIKNFCRQHRCSIAKRTNGYELYGPKMLVRLDLNSPIFFTKERFSEIVYRVISLEKTLLIQIAKND
jgi:hypothetical protein